MSKSVNIRDKVSSGLYRKRLNIATFSLRAFSMELIPVDIMFDGFDFQFQNSSLSTSVLTFSFAIVNISSESRSCLL